MRLGGGLPVPSIAYETSRQNISLPADGHPIFSLSRKQVGGLDLQRCRTNARADRRRHPSGIGINV